MELGFTSSTFHECRCFQEVSRVFGQVRRRFLHVPSRRLRPAWVGASPLSHIPCLFGRLSAVGAMSYTRYSSMERSGSFQNRLFPMAVIHGPLCERRRAQALSGSRLPGWRIEGAVYFLHLHFRPTASGRGLSLKRNRRQSSQPRCGRRRRRCPGGFCLLCRCPPPSRPPP